MTQLSNICTFLAKKKLLSNDSILNFGESAVIAKAAHNTLVFVVKKTGIKVPIPTPESLQAGTILSGSVWIANKGSQIQRKLSYTQQHKMLSKKIEILGRDDPAFKTNVMELDSLFTKHKNEKGIVVGNLRDLFESYQEGKIPPLEDTLYF